MCVCASVCARACVRVCVHARVCMCLCKCEYRIVRRLGVEFNLVVWRIHQSLETFVYGI